MSITNLPAVKVFMFYLFFGCSLDLLYGQPKHPNVIIILADDLGYGDLQCYGSKDIKTPNLDQLAAEGTRFSQFYSNGPECTPTRTALLTGRYQQRVGGLECAIGVGNHGRYEEAIKLANDGKLGLPTRFNILPKILNERDYNTAIIGKWHLGYSQEFRPLAHGFDYSIGPLGGSVDNFHHTERKGHFLGHYVEGKYDLYRNDLIHKREGYYITHLITDEAVEWINKQKSDKPFFLYIPYTAPHNPLQSPDDFQEESLRSDSWSLGDRSDYISVVEGMDKGIGKILEKLKSNGYYDNTIVIFFSDNGPTKNGNTGIFRGNKGGLFEGGIRVPCIIRWPGKIEAGVVTDQTAISMDIASSIAGIIGATSNLELDGYDIVNHLVKKKDDLQRHLYWRKKRGEHVYKAVRNGELKYIENKNSNEVEKYLFNLSEDPSETKNLINDYPSTTSNLKKLLSKWEEEVQPERYFD